MCGLAGEFSFSSPVQYSVIKDMIATLVHRGPDDEGVFCRDKIGLGHRRLSIIDLSTNGRQPMWAEDGSLAIVFNGFSKNASKSSPTQIIKSAFSIIFACEGFRLNPCGEL